MNDEQGTNIVAIMVVGALIIFAGAAFIYWANFLSGPTPQEPINIDITTPAPEPNFKEAPEKAPTVTPQL